MNSAAAILNRNTPSKRKSQPPTVTLTGCSYEVVPEQKARSTYDNILRLCDDPDVREVIKFLRAREVTHYQRFGEGLRIATDRMNEKNFYAINPVCERGKV